MRWAKAKGWAQQAYWVLLLCRGNSSTDFRLTPDSNKLCPYFVLKAQIRSAHVHFGNPDTLIDYFRGKIQSCLCKNGPFCMLAIGAVFLLSAMFGVEALLSSCLHYSSPREIFSYYPALDKIL